MKTREEVIATLFSKEKIDEIREKLSQVILTNTDPELFNNDTGKLFSALEAAAKDIHKTEKQKEIDDGEAAFKTVKAQAQLRYGSLVAGLAYYQDRNPDHYQESKSRYDLKLQKELNTYEKIHEKGLKDIEDKFDKLSQHVVEVFLEVLKEMKTKPPV